MLAVDDCVGVVLAVFGVGRVERLGMEGRVVSIVYRITESQTSQHPNDFRCSTNMLDTILHVPWFAHGVGSARAVGTTNTVCSIVIPTDISQGKHIYQGARLVDRNVE